MSKRKKKLKKGAKEKMKKKAPIEEKKKKFKDQVGKMSPEEIRQHILKMKEKADKLLKKKSFKEFKEDSSAVEERSRRKRRRGEERERKRGKKRSGEEEEESRGMGWWGDQPESGAGEQGEHHLFRGCLFDSHCHLNLVMITPKYRVISCSTVSNPKISCHIVQIPKKNFAKGRYIIAIFWTPGPLDRCLEMTKMVPSHALLCIGV